MKRPLVTADPLSKKSVEFKKYCDVVRLFQHRGIFSPAAVASVIHPGLFAIPNTWYQENKRTYEHNAAVHLQSACSGRFEFDRVQILGSQTASNEDLAALLGRHASKMNCDLLTMSSSDRRGLPYWILGSVSETAALTASVPVLIIKPHFDPRQLAREVKFVLCVDVAAPPSAKEIRWILSLAKSCRCCIYLVYVEPAPRAIVDSLQQRHDKTSASKILHELQAKLQANDLRVKSRVLGEAESIAHTVVDFAEREKTWLIITFSPKRSAARKIALGSRGRSILKLTKRPFLSLRLKA